MKIAKPQQTAVGFWEAFRYWLKLGFINFGGPSGQIALMHKALVEEKRWLSEERFLHALNYCMLLPGPEAQQLAIYIGWLLHRIVGGIVAGVFFVLPSVFILLALSWIYAVHGSISWVAGLFYGLKPAVVAVVAEAVIRIGKKTLKNSILLGLAAGAFTAIYVYQVPFPVIVLAAGVIGFAGNQMLPGRLSFSSDALNSAKEGLSATAISDDDPPQEHTRPKWSRLFKVVVACLSVWWTPIILLGAVRGWDDIFVREGIFFSKAAMVTFGGAYSVLAYLAQQAVHRYGWIRPEQMLDGLGLAETTPGPLIIVTQFVGFMGAFNHPHGFDPVMAGIIGGLVSTWATFAPCFLWIFVGAPFIEYLRGNRHLTGILTSITAAVVGVMLNLAVFFTQHALLPTDGPDWFGIALAIAAFLVLRCWHWGMPAVIGSAVTLGLLWKVV